MKKTYVVASKVLSMDPVACANGIPKMLKNANMDDV